MTRAEDCQHAPISLRVFVTLLAEARCEHSTTDSPTPCFDSAPRRVPFGLWGAGNACISCMAKAALAGQLTVALMSSNLEVDA